MNYSTTQGGNVVVFASALSLVLSKFGVNILPEELSIVLVAIGAAISWYGRWKKGDLTFAGTRKF